MKLVPALVAGVLLLIPAAAQADSTVADPGGSEFTLTDTTGNSNEYVMHDSQASGRWVIYDKTGGKVRITGQANPCQDLPVTTSDGKRYEGVSCPPRTTLKVLMGGNSPDGTYDQINPKVDAATTLTKPFSGRLEVDGGTGTNVIRGSLQSDHLQGGPDGDFLLGRDGDDTLLGGNGNDNLDGGPGADRLAGEDGTEDKCCYWDRTEGVSITLDRIANDGSAQDRNADNVDESNEILATGGGVDTIDTRGVSVPPGTDCNNKPRFRLEAGDSNDTLKGSSCYGDDFDGQGGYDTADFKDRKDALYIDQDNVADDGGLYRAEDDNVRDTIEVVIAGDGNDFLVGADKKTWNDSRNALLVGGPGNDLVVPGRRSEDLIADGFTLTPGDKDIVSYANRTAPVQIALDSAANDGEIEAQSAAAALNSTQSATNAIGRPSAEKDNIANGFETSYLGKSNDFYYGPHSYNIPDGQLPYYETSAQRISVDGGFGDDHMYPGSTAEDFYGGVGSDLVSYILREPSNSFLRVSMSLDGQANDGQSLSWPSLVQEAFEMLLIAPAMAAFIPQKIYVEVSWVKYEEAEPPMAIVRLVDEAGEYLMDVGADVLGTHPTVTLGSRYIDELAPALEGEQAIAFLKRFVEDTLKKAANANAMKAELNDLVVQLEKAVRGSANAVVFGWPAAFSSSLRSELDNIHDDVEQMQGSTNTESGFVGLPIDQIWGNDASNVVLGSPGPDDVVGFGGNDILSGDNPGNGARDWIDGGPGNDWVFGNDGPDLLIGGTGRDALFATDSDFRADGSADWLLCGAPRADFSAPGLLADDGPYEGDTIFRDVSSDHDTASSVCTGVDGPTGGASATAKQTGSTLKITAAAGKRNDLKVSSSGSTVTVTDSKGFIDQAVGCCSGISSIEIDAGDEKDAIDVSKVSSSIKVTAKAGEGNDKITGSPGNDTLYGGPGIDKLKAKAGDDTLQGNEGKDTLDGGPGSDTISYEDKQVAVDVYLAQPSTKQNGETTQNYRNWVTHGYGDLEGDVIKWAESAIGGHGDDIIQGNQLDNTLEGRAGADVFSGGPGSDTIKAKDGTKDPSILCGDGFDHYQVDPVDPITANSSCESSQ